MLWVDVKKVTIDSSKVNPKEVGTYEVTYTVKDSNFNETIAVRKVSVVRGLTDTVKSATGDDNIYKGNSNNYVLFSGMLWRIVSADNNGNVRLILNEGVTSLRFNHEKYEGSNIDTWLKNVFYKALNGKDHLVKTKYCVGNINSMNDYSNYCSVSVNRYVGLLDVNEYYKSFSNGASSVFAKNFALGHVIGDSYAEANYVGDAPGGVTRAVLTPIRPVITLKNDMKIMSGNGTISDPFKLDDYEYAAKKDKINTRIIGEYLEYSGIKFRIIGFDKDKNVRLIMDSQWEVQPAGSVLYIGTEDIEKWVFNPKEDNNTAYILNTDCLDYINTKYIVDTEYEVPTNDPNLIYSKYKTKKVKGKIMLPKTYELFASAGHSDYMYVYIDTSTNNSLVFATNAVNGRVFELHVHDYQTYGVKAVITIKGDLKIESGNGTADSPYKLK